MVVSPSVCEAIFCMNRSCMAISAVERIFDASTRAYDDFSSPSELIICQIKKNDAIVKIGTSRMLKWISGSQENAVRNAEVSQISKMVHRCLLKCAVYWAIIWTNHLLTQSSAQERVQVLDAAVNQNSSSNGISRACSQEAIFLPSLLSFQPNWFEALKFNDCTASANGNILPIAKKN